MSSGETSSIIRRTVKRTVGGGIPEGDNIEVIRNYQVYRGMSPNTSNRLEIRLRELEDALEAERQARLRAEQELSDITIELTTVTERLDEADGQNSAQSEFNRKRDAEFLKLKKDYELLAVQHDSELASLRKRHQDALNELADQLEHLNKNKGKFDKEKQTLIFEIESSNQALDASNKARAHAESKLEGLEDQLRRFKAQLDELTRQNNDLNSWKARLTQENFELHRQVQDLDSSAGSLNKAKALLQAQVDELKSHLDEANSERNSLSLTVNNLQIELENATGRLDEESEASASLRAQLQKALGDLSHLKSKYDQDINIRLGEYEEAKRKSHVRIVELEDLLEQALSKAKKAENQATKLTIEIRDLYSELDQHQRLGADLNKRLKQSETTSLEFQSRVDELNNHLQNTGGDCQRLQLEVARLKAALQEVQDKYDVVQRENKKLSDALRESQGQVKDLTRQVQDLLSIRAQLEAERDRLAVELSDAVDALRDAQARLDASNAALNQLKIDFEHRLREKDEEIESSRKSGQRGIDELQKTVIEIENKYKNEIGKHKKKYDTDIREFEIQLDVLNRSNGELGKANKSLAARVKELEVLFESERVGADEARNALTVSERKRIALQTELEDLRALLEAAERARKAAEAALGDNSSRVSDLNITISAALNERKRLEGELSSYSMSLEESHAARRASDERADRLQLEVNRLASELARAQENYAQADSLRKGLETEIREISLRLEEAESYAQREGKRLVAKLQGRVRDLEAELEAEQRRSRDVITENKRLARAFAELKAQAEEDHRLVVELTDQINSLQSKIALYKRQLLEADEVINITLSKYRKAQQQLEECERRAETAERNITIQVNRGVSVHHGHHGSLALPPTAGGRARSLSVTRETHRVVRA